MASQDFSLRPRKEKQREAVAIKVPVQFSLQEIKKHFDEGMQVLKEQYEVAENLLAQHKDAGCRMVWRSQVLMAEGMLDFYIHEISKYGMFRMFTGQWEASLRYANFMVPISSVQQAVAAKETKDWFFKYINERFSREVYLSGDSMKDQLNMVGIAFAKVMVKAFAPAGGSEEEAVRQGSKIVRALFERRNAIAHQNDRSHESAEENEITRDYVESYVIQVEKLATAIYAVAAARG